MVLLNKSIGKLALIAGLSIACELTFTSCSKAPHGTVHDTESVYAGSESCRDCHRSEYGLWKSSHHGLAERPIQPNLDTDAFSPSRQIEHGSQIGQARVENGNFEIVTRGFQTNIAPYRVERVIGVEPVRQYLTAAAGGRWQVHELAFDPLRGDWLDVYGNEDRQPGEWGYWTGAGMNWNSRCAECHNTRLQKNYDQATDTYHTTMAEISVSCEGCHGPLKEHVEWQRKYPSQKSKDTTLHSLNASQAVETCGSCHSRREDLTGDFVPGDSFHDHYSMEVLDDAQRWYADGQIKDEDYEYASFLSSKMYQSGVRCMDCHNPHSAKTILSGNDLCMRCHTGTFPKAPIINVALHGNHRLGSKGNDCIGCHMPTTVYMQRHERHDHGFTIPDPLLTKELAIPNACNRCHTDKPADWAVGYVQKWYGDKMNRSTRERARWIAAAERGDAGAKEKLVSMLTGKTESAYWRAVAASLLWQWTSDTTVKEALLAALNDEDPLVREKTAHALESLVNNGDAATIVALKPLLKDEDRNVRVATAWAMRATVDATNQAGIELQKTFDFDADQPRGQFRNAMFLLSRHQSSEALQHLQKAISLDAFSPALRFETASLLNQLGRHDDAAEQLQVACKVEPQSPEAHFKLGETWAEAREFEKAIPELQEAVKLEPDYAVAWYNLGLAEAEVNKTLNALDSLHQAEKLAPNDSQIPFACAKVLVKSDRFPEARTEANKALKIQPNFAPARELLQSLSKPGNP